MSDSLVLKGLKDVRKHTGSEMLLMNPKRGGNSYPVKKWWAANASQTTYVGCSVFKVTQAGLSVYLAIDTAEMTTIRVDSEAAFVFNFYNIHQISRAALFTDSWELIEHYAFPKISGGKIMTVTPPGAPVRPSGGSPISFTSSGNITGTLEVGEVITVTGASYNGGVGSVSLSNILQSSDDGNAPWGFVSSSANNSFTHTIGAGLEGKFLRESTQLTDDNGLSTRNGTAQGPVAA